MFLRNTGIHIDYYCEPLMPSSWRTCTAPFTLRCSETKSPLAPCLLPSEAQQSSERRRGPILGSYLTHFLLLFFVFLVSLRGALLSPKQKSTGRSKCAMLLRRVDMGLSKWWRSWASSSGASAAVARFGRSLIKSRRRSRISRDQPRAVVFGAARAN